MASGIYNKMILKRASVRDEITSPVLRYKFNLVNKLNLIKKDLQSYKQTYGINLQIQNIIQHLTKTPNNKIKLQNIEEVITLLINSLEEYRTLNLDNDKSKISFLPRQESELNKKLNASINTAINHLIELKISSDNKTADEPNNRPNSKLRTKMIKRI